MLVKTWYHC